jgi:transaldolase
VNPLQQLWQEHGQAVWLDYIERDLVTGGGLARMVAEDGVRGVTSNPSIFASAMTSSGAYDEQMTALLDDQPELSTAELYEALAISDIQAAADVLRPVYDEGGGGDGFVSLEVSPHLAHDTGGTIEEAHRLWRLVDRPNLMIKVPATAEGVPALEQLIADGVNVNATLIFSLDHYEGVAQAYLRGVQRCAEPTRVASVASFFVSRVDTKVDAILGELATERATALLGTAAVANAQLAYARFRELFHGADFEPLAARGVRVQRPLWASTSTKNPDYDDVKYVEELVGPETVNTIPTATLEAYRNHGRPGPTLEAGMATATQTLDSLQKLGISMDSITAELQVEGVAAFASSFDQLIAALGGARTGAR